MLVREYNFYIIILGKRAVGEGLCKRSLGGGLCKRAVEGVTQYFSHSKIFLKSQKSF